MNANDSDWLRRSLLARGFAETLFEEASFYILNTCSVRDKPEQKVYSELGRIARHCKVHGRSGVTVCVGGCVAQQVGPALARRFPQVRLLFGTDGVAHAPEAVERLAEEPRLRLSLLDFAARYEERDPPAFPGPVPAAAFVNIMQGCDNYCAYCIVPYVRGRQKSRLPESVLDECRALTEGGAREITLLGQNVNSYGQDLAGGGASFADLLFAVGRLPGLERLRFVTSHPKDIADEVIQAFGSLETLCPRLHLPLQSGSDRILAAMGRKYDTARYRDIVRKLRAARPDIIFTTDIITGFPGETEEDFAATMGMMRAVPFAASFSFVYSDRPGARAALLPGKVERAVALERLLRLQAWQNQASEDLLAAQVGTETVILVEGKSRGLPGPDGRPDGRIDGQAGNGPANGPDGAAESFPDGFAGAPGTEEGGEAPEAGMESWQGRTAHGHIVNVLLPSPPPAGFGARPVPGRGWEGAMLPVRIKAAARHSLKGKQAGEPW